MIFDFFKVLFKKDAQKTQQQNQVVDNEPIEINEAYKPPVQKPSSIQQKKIINKPKVKSDIINETSLKEINMAEIFLVTIDTTGRPEAKGFVGGLQDFYFVFAQSDTDAKNIVLSTFRSRPGMMDQLQNATKATRLGAILKMLGPGSNFWTYIPFGHQRQPGQQGIPPNPEKLLRSDEFGNPSSQAYVPPAPAGGEQITEDDLKGVQFSGADAKIMNKLRGSNPDAPGLPGEETAPSAEQNKTIDELKATNANLVATQMAIMEQMKSLGEVVKTLAEKPKRTRKAPPSDPSPPTE